MKQSAENATVHQNIQYPSEDFKVLVSDQSVGPQKRGLHDAIEIKYFYQGRSLLMIGSDIIMAECGDITVANPYEIHVTAENDFCTGRYILLMLDLDFFVERGIGELDLRRLLLVNRFKFNHRIRNNERLQQIMLRVKEEMEAQKDLYRLAVSGLLAEFFVLLLRDELCEGGAAPNEKGDIYRNNVILPALRKISSDYGARITVDELAQLCNLSKYHFCRIFKRYMGVTAIQYLVNYRVFLADRMLRDGKQSVRSIAQTCGFGDLSYFYQCYKRIKGVTPGSEKRNNT